MNLYKISQTQNNDYDTYDSAIVCAESADQARLIGPCGQVWTENRKRWDWCWCKHPDQVTVELIGVADPSIAPGVVLASFNAG